MSKSLNILISTLILAGTGHAVAASNTDLTVRGSITPSACTPNLSNGGKVDHGKISAQDLSQTSQNVLKDHVLSLTVNCDAAIAFALNAIDNRAGTGNYPYGLGFVNGNRKLGRYDLTLANPIADGVPAQVIASHNQGDTWVRLNAMLPGRYMSVATLDDFSQPLPTKDLIVDLNVRTYIYGTSGLDLSDDIPIDGSATLEVKYL